MTRAITYKAVNDIDGETHKGTGKGLAQILGVTSTTINKASIEGKMVRGQWYIYKTEKPEDKNGRNTIPDKLLLEWDRVTKPFKNAIRKKQVVS